MRVTDANNPADWLFLAESDLAGLRILADQEVSYHLCMSKLAEVVEKVFKAYLVYLGWRLVKTHDLVVLAKELESRLPVALPALRDMSTSLAERYFTYRYPGFDLEEPDWVELRRLLAQLDSLMTIVREAIATSGDGPPRFV